MYKKFPVCLAFLLLAFHTSFSQWTWLNPKPSPFSCTKILFTDSLKGYILSGNGDLSRTLDQGETWSYQQNFPGTTIFDLKDSTGVICGSYGTLYISSDRGTSWVRQITGIADNFFKADVVSRDTIFLATSNGKIFRSDDRGNTWKTFSCGIQLSSIEFINSKVGYVGGTSSYILKTEDGGETWQRNVTVSTTPSNTMTIKFIDINNGFAFRDHSDLLSTKDGGQTWNEYDVYDDIYAFSFVNDTTGFACGEFGAIYRTNNGGMTWQFIGPTARIDAYELQAIYFINANTGFSVGTRGRILKTINGGATWAAYSPTYSLVSDITVPASNIAYATVGNNIFKTVDRGESWQQLGLLASPNYPQTNVFETCLFFNADTGLVTASGSARVYKTYDGGLNWKLIQPSRYNFEHVSCLQFVNRNMGFLALITANGGEIAKTKDGGETWTTAWKSQFSGELFTKIHFINEKTGYASRDETLYKTEDSAKTWTEVWRDNKTISTIVFTNPQTGFVGGAGMLKRTSDSGKTWTQVEYGSNVSSLGVNNIEFINEQVGYLTAAGGVIFKTIDSGYTWQSSGQSFFKTTPIAFAPDSSVYIAGEFGSILRADTRSIYIGPCSRNEWTGIAGAAWENAANWSCGTIPGPNTDVIIPGWAVVTINSYVSINSLTIRPGAALSIGWYYNLNVLH